MEHYRCTGGCKGVSDRPGNCQAMDCSKHGQPLEKYEGGDAMHGEKNGCCGKCRKKCGCMHHKMFFIFALLFGILFLLQAFEVLDERIVAISWPIIIILAALSKMFGGKCKCC